MWTNTLGVTSGESLQFTPVSIAIAADGEIYVIDGAGTVYSFCPDGTTNWTYQTDTSELNAPLIGPDGTVYVQDCMGSSIYAFAGPAPVACSSWPEYGKNARRAAAVAYAQLSSPNAATNAFRFTISGFTNMPACVCASTNLVNWTNIGSVVLKGGMTNFVDAMATNFPYRFYQALPQ